VAEAASIGGRVGIGYWGNIVNVIGRKQPGDKEIGQDREVPYSSRGENKIM
jgi:hypothetical protein